MGTWVKFHRDPFQVTWSAAHCSPTTFLLCMGKMFIFVAPGDEKDLYNNSNSLYSSKERQSFTVTFKLFPS